MQKCNTNTAETTHDMRNIIEFIDQVFESHSVSQVSLESYEILFHVYSSLFHKAKEVNEVNGVNKMKEESEQKNKNLRIKLSHEDYSSYATTCMQSTFSTCPSSLQQLEFEDSSSNSSHEFTEVIVLEEG